MSFKFQLRRGILGSGAKDPTPAPGTRKVAGAVSVKTLGVATDPQVLKEMLERAAHETQPTQVAESRAADPSAMPHASSRASSQPAVEACLTCEGCLVVRSGHGPQAEVAQGVEPEPLVEL